MKAKRLIEILRSVSPNADVMCCISTDDLEEVTNMTLAPFKHKNYEIFCVLIADGDDSCRLLLKKNSYQYNPKGVRNKSSIVDEGYNMDFINEMKYIEQEKSIPINCQQLEEEHEKNKKLEENITEIFNHTKNELGMGGELKHIQYTNDLFLVESEHRMDSNMMHTIMKHTNSTILLGNSENNVLVFKIK